MITRIFASVCCLLALLTPATADETKFRVLYDFANDPDNASRPTGDLARDASGNLYGVTTDAFGPGIATVFKLSSNGTKTTIMNFPNVRHGAQDPLAPLVLDGEGNVFGATAAGGLCGRTGCGTIFKIAPDGTATTLLALDRTQGMRPGNGLLLGDAGDLYDVVRHGKDIKSGAIFKLSPDGQYTLIHAFHQRREGQYPIFGLVADKRGNFYGSTSYGGPVGGGTIFRYAPNGFSTVLHAFFATDGFSSQSPLTVDRDGNVYGVLGTAGPDIAGSIFRIGPDGTFTALHFFDGQDGDFPTASPIIDKNGNLYGITSQGGTSGNGVVYRLVPNGTLTVLHNFTGGADGFAPNGRLTSDGHGHLFGATAAGGDNRYCGFEGCGVIFEVDMR